MNTHWLISLALVVSSIHVIESKGFRARSSRGSHSSHRGQGSSRGNHNSHGGHGSSRGTQSSHVSSHGSSGGSSRGSSQRQGSGGSHSYPKSPHLSGHGPGSGGYYGSYYSSPQHVYVAQYRESGSRYDNILSGLTMYNLGRSHSHYHHHYYQDSYYRSSTAPRSQDQYSGDTVDNLNGDTATCFLKIRKNWHEEAVKVPCAIVSTFSNENDITSDINQNDVIPVQNCSSVKDVLLDRLDESTTLNRDNMTSCVSIEDPLSVKGAPIDAESMECLVEILTKGRVIKNNVDCGILLKYSEMPIPPMKTSVVLPQREKLKAMLDKPPWWLSLFIAV